MVNSRAVIYILILICIPYLILYHYNDWLIIIENKTPSQIYKKEQNRFVINNAKRIPSSGSNFQTYSRFLSAIGRTHVHEKVRNAILNAYKTLEKTQPNVIFIYGETGWKNGGNFWPHRTHRNGLCVDFMVPVFELPLNEPSVMFLWLFNARGYNTRFNSVGRTNSYSINFEAIIEHLYRLQAACKLYSLKIKLVIFDLNLLKILKQSDNHDRLKTIPFADFKAWFPHDSHYHVEFEIDESLPQNAQ